MAKGGCTSMWKCVWYALGPGCNIWGLPRMNNTHLGIAVVSKPAKGLLGRSSLRSVTPPFPWEPLVEGVRDWIWHLHAKHTFYHWCAPLPLEMRICKAAFHGIRPRVLLGQYWLFTLAPAFQGLLGFVLSPENPRMCSSPSPKLCQVVVCFLREAAPKPPKHCGQTIPSITLQAHSFLVLTMPWL